MNSDKQIKNEELLNLIKEISSFLNSKECKSAYENWLESKQDNYFAVPEKIFKSHLSSTEINVYCCLSCYSDKNRQCDYSKQDISKLCGVSKATVVKALKTLEAKGYIKSQHTYINNGASKGKNHYTILR